MTVPECIASVESMNIFPIGWCETNGYQLRPPRRAVGMNNMITIKEDRIVLWNSASGSSSDVLYTFFFTYSNNMFCNIT